MSPLCNTTLMVSFLLLGLTLRCTMVHAGLMKGEVTRKNDFDLRGSRRKQRQRKLQMEQNDDAVQRCPKEYSLLHCEDPSIIYAIPCDWATCLWDVSAFSASSPPTLCSGAFFPDPQAVIADAFKPCLLWSIIYGEHQSVSPTTSATPSIATLAPALAPVPTATAAPVMTTTTTVPVSKEPVIPPTADGIVYFPDEGTYQVSFDTMLINFFVRASSSSSLETTTDAFMTRDGQLWVELNDITQTHILKHIRNQLNDYDETLVLSVSTNFSSLSIQEPWNNGTVLVSETLSGHVTIHEDYGMPRRDATTNMVKESFELHHAMTSYLLALSMASDPTLQQIDSMYLGLPSEVIDTTTITEKTEPPMNKESAVRNSNEKDNVVKELSDSIEWGDWSDTYFISFVGIVAGVIFMMCSVITLCYCLRRRANQRRRGLKDLKMKVSEDTSNDILSPESTANTENSPLRVIALSPSKTTPLEDSNSKSSEDAPVDEAPKIINHGRRFVEAEPSDYDDDIQSDVYSYIDTNTVDDHCYSVAGALMYNPHIPGDDIHSVNWSVAGRTTGLGGVGTLVNNSDRHQTPQRDNTTANNSVMNLSSMLGESNTSDDNVVIFCDPAVEDDSVSLINDSLLHNTTLDHQTEQQYENHEGFMMSSKHSNKNAMSTNARVAAVVAKLEGKTLLSSSFSSHTTQTERTTNRNVNEQDDDNEEVGCVKSSGSRGEVTEEGSPSTDESVTLSSYVAMPYQNDRQAATTAVNYEKESKPKSSILSLAKSAKVTNGKSVRGKSSFFRSTSTGTTENAAPWGIPTGESTNENDNNTSDNRKKGFWARTQANRNSKATQMVLGSASSPSSDSVPKTATLTSPTESFVSPVASSSPSNNNISNNFLPVQQIKLFEQYEESESDIQSICTFDDDRSYFSGVKSSNNKGSTQLTDQQRNSLSNRLPPVTNHHSSYIQSMYKKY